MKQPNKVHRNFKLSAKLDARLRAEAKKKNSPYTQTDIVERALEAWLAVKH